jgi:Skp family chaperone for outer membrane proteins
VRLGFPAGGAVPETSAAGTSRIEENRTVKRTVIVAAGMMALSLCILVSHRLGAQSTPARPAGTPATPKIGLINLTYVVKNYERFKAFNEELKSAVKPYQDNDTNYKKQGEVLAKEAGDQKTSAERREQIERQLTELKRKIEDNQRDAQKALAKKQDDQLKILYMDIHGVVTRYAQAHGYDMVMHFHDALDRDQYWSAANIARKMQVGSLLPMYYAPSLDISGHIVATLNASYKGGTASAPKR